MINEALEILEEIEENVGICCAITMDPEDGKQWNINETLISEGHAYVYDGGKKQLFKG
jgi:endonuclease YncB( thermonuclease family)